MLYEYRGMVERVVDGDTIDMAWIDLGFGIIKNPPHGGKLRMRLALVDAFETTLRGDTTPEQKAKGLEAKAWLKEQVEGKVVRIRTVPDAAQGSFGRWLIWLWDDEPDEHVLDVPASYNQRLIDLGFGVVYEGG